MYQKKTPYFLQRFVSSWYNLVNNLLLLWNMNKTFVIIQLAVQFYKGEDSNLWNSQIMLE